MRDINEMLARHDRDQDDLLEVAGVVAKPVPELPPRRPRTHWPKNKPVDRWPASARAEFAYWARKLYEEGQSISQVALTLNVPRKVVASEVHRQGIFRKPAMSTEERRGLVKALYDERDGEIGPFEAGELLGVSKTTMVKDYQALGLLTSKDRAKVRRKEIQDFRLANPHMTMAEIGRAMDAPPTTVASALAGLDTRPAHKADPRAERTVGRAIASMADTAELVLTHAGGLPPLDPEVAALWERQLREIARAIRTVRKHAKGETNG